MKTTGQFNILKVMFYNKIYSSNNIINYNFNKKNSNCSKETPKLINLL